MSDKRDRLIQLNMKRNLVTPLTEVICFHSDIKRLLTLKSFKEVMPRLTSIYRHLDKLPESLLNPRDVQSFRDMVVKAAIFSTSILDKEVISVNDYNAMGDEAKKSIRRNKQAIITESDEGREFYKIMLNVEKSFDMIRKRMENIPLFHLYRIARIYELVQNNRYIFLTKNVGVLEYVRSLILLVDILHNVDMIKADVVFSTTKRSNHAIDEVESIYEVNCLSEAMLTAKRIHGEYCIFTSDELRKAGVCDEVIEYIEWFKAEIK